MPSIVPLSEPGSIRFIGYHDQYPGESRDTLLKRLDTYLDDNAEAFTEKHSDWVPDKARKAQDREGVLKMMLYAQKVVKNVSVVAGLNDYTISPTDFVYPDGKTKYSCGWKITVPSLKAERYAVKPLMEGQMNLGYYELLAGIWDETEKQVGLCFVELLLGVYNEKFSDTVSKRGAKE